MPGNLLAGIAINRLGDLMEEKNKCMTCYHFSSYRNEYDDDPFEPDDVGRCYCDEHTDITKEDFADGEGCEFWKRIG